MAVIALGGAVGASLRHAISLAVQIAQWHPAFGAALANLVGSFLLGLLVGVLESAKLHPLLRPFLTIGVFGSFTTFSALALDNRALANESGEALAAIHLAVSIVSGLLAFILGDYLAGSRADRGER
jgi:CrcB protein